jgi:hypothetical protein
VDTSVTSPATAGALDDARLVAQLQGVSSRCSSSVCTLPSVRATRSETVCHDRVSHNGHSDQIVRASELTFGSTEKTKADERVEVNDASLRQNAGGVGGSDAHVQRMRCSSTRRVCVAGQEAPGLPVLLVAVTGGACRPPTLPNRCLRVVWPRWDPRPR